MDKLAALESFLDGQLERIDAGRRKLNDVEAVQHVTMQRVRIVVMCARNEDGYTDQLLEDIREEYGTSVFYAPGCEWPQMLLDGLVHLELLNYRKGAYWLD